MPQYKEQEIRLQFLEEATENLETITEAILTLAVPSTIDNQQMDAVIRAAHSIKGGAAMIGFQTLNKLACHMEASLKVLKKQQQQLPIETHLNKLLIAATDHLSTIIYCHRQGEDIDEQWVEKIVYPIFNEIDLTLGSNPTFKDSATLLEPENDQDLLVLIFKTEVEGYLAELESVLASGALPGLFAQTSTMAQELGSLGEILELTAFTSLCESVIQHLEATPERVEEIARIALQEWRRSQAAVLLGQVDTIPTSIDLGMGERGGDKEDLGDKKKLSLSSLFHLLHPLPHSLDAPVPAPTNIQAKDFKKDHSIKFNENHTVRLTIKQLQQLKDYFAQLSQLHSRTTFCLTQVSNLLEQVGIPNDEFTTQNSFGNGVSAPPSEKLSKVSHPEIEQRAALEPTRQKITILVIDDDKSIRSFLSSLLESAGYQVELALDGRDALIQLDNGLQVQTVICDLDMPNLDGFGFLTSLKSDPNFNHLPVVMLTSHTESKYRNRAMLLGAAAYFTKPCDQQELVNSLGQLIGNAPALKRG